MLLEFQDIERLDIALPGATARVLDLDPGLSPFDLQLSIAERPAGSGVQAAFTYATDLFDAATIASFADRFVRILDAVTADAAVTMVDDWLKAAKKPAVAPVSSTRPSLNPKKISRTRSGAKGECFDIDTKIIAC